MLITWREEEFDGSKSPNQDRLKSFCGLFSEGTQAGDGIQLRVPTDNKVVSKTRETS